MLDDPQLYAHAVYSVADLNAYIRALLESNENLMDIWVEGEISNLSRPRSGHVYFTLKDESASVRCVVWRVNAGRISGTLRDGMLVEAHGYVSVYESGGQYQLYVDGIRTAGEGRIYREFLILKEKLTAEGLFDEERKRPLPRQPKVIGIVTSPTGAALQDMLNALRNQFPMVEVVLSPASVQGDAAPQQIVDALDRLNRFIHPDLILIGRGGGSLEDLWAFNDEGVVRAVAASTAPVISGVGHETDFTLTDFVADQRAPTPTGSAMLAVPEMGELAAEFQRENEILEQVMSSRLQREANHLQEMSIRLNYLSPGVQINQQMQGLDNIGMRIDHLVKGFFLTREQQLILVEEKIGAFDPRKVLKRGYAVVEDSSGDMVTSVKQVQLGQDIHVNLADGIISADVTEVNNKE